MVPYRLFINFLNLIENRKFYLKPNVLICFTIISKADLSDQTSWTSLVQVWFILEAIQGRHHHHVPCQTSMVRIRLHIISLLLSTEHRLMLFFPFDSIILSGCCIFNVFMSLYIVFVTLSLLKHLAQIKTRNCQKNHSRVQCYH